MVLSIIIPILSLIVGLNFANYILATMMIVIEIIFSILLAFENKKIKNDQSDNLQFMKKIKNDEHIQKTSEVLKLLRFDIFGIKNFYLFEN